MMLKEVADRLVALKNKRRIARRRENRRRLLLGATLGTAAGAAAGILLAPQSGRKTREQISRRTGDTLETIRSRASSAGEVIADRVQHRAARLREAAEACSENIMEAVKEPIEEAEADKKKKK